MNSIKRILGAFAGAFAILLAFQNCGQPGSLALNSQATESSKLSATTDPGLIVAPIDQPTPPPKSPSSITIPPNTDGAPPVAGLPPVAPLQCDTMGLSDISLNVLEVKAPSASGASSHLFEIIKNDSAVGAQHTILVRALHSAKKIDKIDLEMAKTGSLMLAANQQTLLGVSAAIEGHKIRLMLDRQDYAVVQGQTYTLSFKVDATKQAVKDSCEAKKCDSDDDEDKDDVDAVKSSNHLQSKVSLEKDDEDKDDDEDDGKKCVPKPDECRLFLHLSAGSLKSAQ